MANDTPDLEPLLNAEQQQLSLVMSEADSIDNKSLAILAVIVAILLYIAQSGLRLTEWWHRVVVLGPFCLALISNGFAIWPRHYAGASPDIEAEPENLTLDRNSLVLQLLANTNLAAKHNNQLNQRRWLYCVGSIVFLLLGSAVLFAIL